MNFAPFSPMLLQQYLSQVESQLRQILQFLYTFSNELCSIFSNAVRIQVESQLRRVNCYKFFNSFTLSPMNFAPFSPILLLPKSRVNCYSCQQQDRVSKSSSSSFDQFTQ
eukprot:TRINITY_DN215_c0_g1_i2.p1 TRINITY_DN215_c0_g1~~TRINITY_DN215_c0_g1_i2.p1  ORF type:complete len:110 (+),score=0.21 TRINITY_DN215_c0_g1_i2:224-553(+)